MITQKDPKEGYFYGLNDQTAESAYREFLESCTYPYESVEEALKFAEQDRANGNFVDDNAVVQVFHFKIELTKVTK